ncbi:TPA: hypothetical protein JBD00_14275 [Legionella pneumophila subsp. pneumophila]|nr:hypothetical protein [Legionella pneumophila subsp. pneumophila]HAU0818249.1 hypothetical protein [Legionella pneumophila]
MTTLVQSLQKQALDEALSPSALLRRAKLISKKLNLDDFACWIDNELNGYKNIDDLPEYRITYGTLEGWNPYQGWKPIIFPEKEVEDVILSAHITQSIAEIEKLLLEKDSHGGFLIYRLSGAQEQEICKMIGHHINIRKLIAKTTLDNIINKVKNTILDWSIKLEEEGITGAGVEFTAEEKQNAQANQSFHIQNFIGNIGDINQSQVTQHISITENNLKELSDYLLNNKVSQSDINTLKSILQSEPKPKQANQYGKRLSSWLGKMIKKAANGTWETGLNVASNILTSAINKYYGL